jgi:hypothetical protein
MLLVCYQAHPKSAGRHQQKERRQGPGKVAAIQHRERGMYKPHTSAFGGKADMAVCIANVAF